MKALRFAVPLAYMAAIYALSSIPDTQTDPANLAEQALQWTPPTLQNLLHIPLYGGLAVSWYWALLTAKSASQATRLLLMVALTIAYGVYDEVHQLSVPGRYGSVTDLILNTIGALVAAALIAMREKPTRPQPD